MEVFRDEGVSAKVAPQHRPGLQGALLALTGDEAEGLVFTKLDRVARNLSHALALFEDFRKQGWNIACAQEAIDTTTALCRLTFHVLAAFAEFEASQASERTRASMTYLAGTQRVHSRFTPFGYRLGAPDGPWTPPARERDARGRKVGGGETRELGPV